MKRNLSKTAILGLLLAIAPAHNVQSAVSAEKSRFENKAGLSQTATAREELLLGQTTASFKQFGQSLYLLSRQNFEMKKTAEISTLLESLVGSGQAGVYLEFRWPEIASIDEAAAGELRPDRIQAFVVLTRKFTQKEELFIQDLATRVLGIIPQRGDSVNIYSMQRQETLGEVFMSPSAILDLIKFFIMVSLALGCLFAMLKIRAEVKTSLEKLIERAPLAQGEVTLASGYQDQPPPIAFSQNQAAMNSQSPLLSSGGSQSPTAAFSRADPDSIARVLEEEDSRSIAIFISALESDLAGKVLSNLSGAKQEEVALTLPQMVEPDPREVAQLQAQIHLKLRRLSIQKK